MRAVCVLRVFSLNSKTNREIKVAALQMNRQREKNENIKHLMDSKQLSKRTCEDLFTFRKCFGGRYAERASKRTGDQASDECSFCVTSLAVGFSCDTVAPLVFCLQCKGNIAAMMLWQYYLNQRTYYIEFGWT